MLRKIGCGLLVSLAALAVSKTAVAQEATSDGAAVLSASGCAACHGPQGRGTALAPSIAGPVLDRQAFFAAVRSARGAMPAFGPDVLSDAHVTALHAYLSGLTPAERPDGDAEAGARRYESVGCYSCHSNQGQGVLHGPRIAPQPIRWGRFAWYVRHPAGQMPPYSEVVLSERDLADIYAFLASRPSPPAVEDLPLLAP